MLNVKLYRNGRNQALQIPRELELPDKKAIIRNEGDRPNRDPARAPDDAWSLDVEYQPIPELDLDPFVL